MIDFSEIEPASLEAGGALAPPDRVYSGTAHDGRTVQALVYGDGGTAAARVIVRVFGTAAGDPPRPPCVGELQAATDLLPEGAALQPDVLVSGLGPDVSVARRWIGYPLVQIGAVQGSPAEARAKLGGLTIQPQPPGSGGGIQA